MLLWCEDHELANPDVEAEPQKAKFEAGQYLDKCSDDEVI
jgi:hypothetical protein